MARGKPGIAPHAGRGGQTQKTRSPSTGRIHNNHYSSYSKSNHNGNK